ncbi:response regulator [Litorisediminicola beolgyonensis]|uniref:Response regulator n=1 Tax=Litorisediminicola beolgyonensis TaxID=1173614 RepID=A0ABW3ZF22_9RHOB
MRILAVDDDPIILELLSEIVVGAGGDDILTATSGPEALDLLDDPDTGPIDCFLLDVQMPVMNGIDLCAEIRRIPDYRATPIIMLTAMTEKPYIDSAFRAGATDYVSKPFDVAELRRRLKTAMLRKTELSRQADMQGAGGFGGLLSPIPIYDVDNCIAFFAFENYVQQLSRQSLFGSLLMAFNIRKVEAFYNNCDTFTFEGLIADVAETISDCMRDRAFVLSYAGNGTFACLIEDGNFPERAQLVDWINECLQKQDLFYGPDCPLVLRISAGEMVRLIGRNSAALDDAIVHATASAEAASIAAEARIEDLWSQGVAAE